MQVERSEFAPFLPLVESFFDQTRAFGCFCAGAAWKDQLHDSDVPDRVAFLQSLCKLLESAAGLRFGNREVPLLYHTNGWPDDAEPAGYVDASLPLAPSDYMVSLWMAWNFQASMHAQEVSGVRRFLKAALWVAKRSGTPAAIRYLFDLLRHGYFVDATNLYGTVQVLARGSRQTTGDINEWFFGDPPPQSPREFIHAEFADRSFDDGEHVRPLPPELTKALVTAGLDQISRVRSAGTYDHWLCGQFVLLATLNVVESVLKKHLIPLPLTLTSVLDQFEEMRADAGGLTAALLGISDVPVMSVFRSAAGRPMVPGALNGMMSADRLLNERAMVPDVLKDVLLGDNKQPLPAEWQALSPPFARVFQLALLGGNSSGPLRARRLSAEHVLTSSAAAEVFAAAGLHDPGIRAVVAREYSGDWEPHRHAGIVREIEMMRRGGREDVSDRNADASDLEFAAAEEWLAANQDIVERTVKDLHVALRIEDLVDRIDAATRLSDSGASATALAALENLLTDYPWQSDVAYELAIARDKAGNPQGALDVMMQALRTDPDRPLYWHSLGVMFAASGRKSEWALALSVVGMFRQSRRWNVPDMAEFWRDWDRKYGHLF